jgi:hypothetical protein
VSKFGSDQIEVAFDVKAMTNNTVGTVNYFVALVEDVVLYDAPNGEKFIMMFSENHHQQYNLTFFYCPG